MANPIQLSTTLKEHFKIKVCHSMPRYAIYLGSDKVTYYSPVTLFQFAAEVAPVHPIKVLFL